MSALPRDEDCTVSPAGIDGAPVLEVRGLSKTFPVRRAPSHVALRDVSFSIARGTCLALVGESGSGKTTAARIIAGLERATSGTVVLNAARRVQMVFQDPYGSLDPRQTIGAGLHELLSLHGVRRRERAERVTKLLHDVGLDERHAGQRPKSLSGGQRQRAAIARALALEPALLILDEAVSALDVSVQAQVLNLLADIRERSDISYLFVSHDLAVVRQVSDTCVVLQHGRVVEQGPTADVLDRPEQPYTRALIDAIPRPGWRPGRRTDR
ncbi:ABC transporter ATP-binding protein [Nonomuraea sp. NPDC050783]|uniref:ABC transporter ATP-binding protein n=1 Tax=Nonomuraea sp. NPDC050783 TaxID=3154634 RepID=UPI0034650207